MRCRIVTAGRAGVLYCAARVALRLGLDEQPLEMGRARRLLSPPARPEGLGRALPVLRAKRKFRWRSNLAQRLLLNGALVTATRDSGSTQKDFRQPHLTTSF